MAIPTLLLTSPTGEVQRLQISKPQLSIGRSVLNDVVIRDQAVSRTHACLEFGADVLLRDLGSANGTLLNGEPVASARLTIGDVVKIGSHTLQLVPDIVEDDVVEGSTAAGGVLETTVVADPLESIVNDTSLPRLAVMTPWRTWEVPLQADPTVIGRGPACHVVIDSPKVSRKHAQVERAGDRFTLRDLASSNGVWMAGRRVEREALRHGDTFVIGEARCVFKAGFAAEDLTILELPRRARQRRPVVIVPGLMGSNLFLGNQQVWPNLRMMVTEPDIFKFPGPAKLEARGLVSEVVVIPNLIKLDQYNRLTEYLAEGLSYEPGNDLLEFAYDWRQDVRVTARQLQAAIERWGMDEPITIIAHSLGSLVTRYYVDCLGGSKRVDRIVFLGAPHHGGPKSVVGLIAGASPLPFGFMSDKGREVMATYPSSFQVLPTYPAVTDRDTGLAVDVLADDRWVPDEQKACHAMAREFRKELPERCSVSAVSIFGYGLKTITGVIMTRDTNGRCPRVEVVSEDLGDSLVPQVASVLPGSEIHPVRQHHGSLYTDKDVQMRLKVELTR